MVLGSARNWIAVDAVQQSNFKRKKHMKTITNMMYPTLVALSVVCFGLSPTAQAQLSPPPGGGYPNQNTALGADALFSLTVGGDNTAIGTNALYSNSEGNRNTATGSIALYSNTFGFENTAIGNLALVLNTTGSENTAVGASALQNNAADNSTAVGAYALYSNTTGNFNTASGAYALYSNDTGIANTATGVNALLNNITGDHNTASGSFALMQNTGAKNTATGANALVSNTTGSFNTAMGHGALDTNTTGSRNAAEGQSALARNTTGNLNVALGFHAGLNLTTGDYNIDIGNEGVVGEANTIRIGTQGTQAKAFIAGISTTGVMGSALKISSSGQLGVAPSSARFKQEIQNMDKASEALLALRPVTFRYKRGIDPEGVQQFGLVAEEVEQINSDLVAHDADGKPYTVRYDAVNAMLLNEFLKEHHQMQDLKAIVAQQQKQIEALTAGLQNVSAQLEASKPTPQVVLNRQ
jgi:hypothetical protein